MANTDIVVILSTLLLGILIRFIPFLYGQKYTGVDQWYWLSYIKALKKNKRFPPELPLYRLEKKQWYPPLFPLIISFLPQSILNKYSRLVAITIDLIRLGLLFFLIHLMEINNPWVYAISGLAYITTPVLITYNTQLNPRGLGALFFDGAMILLSQYLHAPHSLFLWMTAVGVASLVLLNHKMTTQLLFFLCVIFSIAFQDIFFLGHMLSIIFGAMLMSGFFYVKVLRAHWDILKFWTREWPLLGADPLKESPLYGEKGYQGPTRQFEPGLKNYLKRFLSLIFGNYAPIAIGGVILIFMIQFRTSKLEFMGVWLAGCVLFSVLTVMVPFLRGLGHGNLYLYNAAFPAAFIMGYAVTLKNQFILIIVIIFLFLNLIALYNSLKYFKKQTQDTIPESLLSVIRDSENGTWLTFPMTLMEHVQYLTNKPVLWGAHGYGFKEIGQVFPVIRTPIDILMKKYDLRFILANESYLDDLKKIPVYQKILFQENGFCILELRKELL